MELTWVLLPDRNRYSLLSLYFHFPFVTFLGLVWFFKILLFLFWQVLPYVYETPFYFCLTFKLVKVETEPFLFWYRILEDKFLKILLNHSMDWFDVFKVLYRTLSNFIRFFILTFGFEYNHIILHRLIFLF